MSSPPNILWLVTTQWRASATGYAGDLNARTPNLNALAAESVNYTQAVTPHPFGPFARAALLTGVLSPENGVRDYFDPLPPAARTVAHELNERGYATAFFGKWHLASRDPAADLVGEAHAKMIVPPAARGGFEFWEGFESGFLLNDPWLHGTRHPEPVQIKGYQSDVLCERVAKWFQSALAPAVAGVAPDPRPIFCLLSLEAPHPPYDAPAAGMKTWAPSETLLPPNVPRGGDIEVKARRELAGYYAHLEATDKAIGALLGKLRGGEGGTARKTVVVFTSVHGDMHGAHGLFRKGWPYEESVRVPLLVRLPGLAGRQDDTPISLVDLAGMTVKWAKGTAMDDASAIARPAYSRISMPSVVALKHQCDRVWRGIRTQTRKLVLNADGSPWLLFDLEGDPLETANLASDLTRAGEIAELRKWV